MQNALVKNVVFIVDDEPELIKVATKLLGDANYAVRSETNPKTALEKIKADPPDLILLDVNMPEMNGLDVCKALKRDPKTAPIPVLFASVKSDEADVVAGLELGGEDYVVKPLRERELLARIRAILRRGIAETNLKTLVCGPFRIDFDSYKVWVDGKLANFTPKQYEVFALFVQNEGKVLTRGRISETVWGSDISRLSRTMDSTIIQVRQKIGPYRDWIKSVKGIGYRFESEE